MVSYNIFWKGHVVKEKMFYFIHSPSIPHHVLVAIASLRPLSTNLPPPLYIVDNCDHFGNLLLLLFC
jgi:hypothetical protein